MLGFRALSRLAAYLGLLLGIGGVLLVSLTVLAGSLQAVRSSATNVEVSPKRKNVPLPPVITPKPPNLERVLTRPAEFESSFATIGPPAGEDVVLQSGGQSDSFVVLGAPARTE